MGFSSIECGDHIDHNDICGKCLFCEIDKLEAEAIREGRTPDQYSVDISMNKVGA